MFLILFPYMLTLQIVSYLPIILSESEVAEVAHLDNTLLLKVGG